MSYYRPVLRSFRAKRSPVRWSWGVKRWLHWDASAPAQRAQLHFRRLDMRMLRELIPMHTDTVQISRAVEARRELEEIFQREMQQERRQLDGWDEFE